MEFQRRVLVGSCDASAGIVDPDIDPTKRGFGGAGQRLPPHQHP
jgi:hypothetical protein